jgi:ABC-2 type transport system ATP-binding protein
MPGKPSSRVRELQAGSVADLDLRVPGAGASEIESRAVALRVRGLSKSFSAVEAVAEVSFEIRQSEVFGLLGLNGAGKTTLISMLATDRLPTAGDAFLFDRSIRGEQAAVRHMIGVAPQDVALYPMLTAVENLRFFGRIYGVAGAALEDRARELIHEVGLDGRGDDYVASFSGGMKRRLNLAAALVHRPKLVLLDEPTAGVDPRSREQILDVVRSLRKAGSAILYTTHYMDEAERLCDRLGILREGRLIAVGTIDALLREMEFSEIIEVRGLPDSLELGPLRAVGGIARVERHDGVLRLYVKGAADFLGPLQRVIGRSEAAVRVKIAPLSLQSLFLHLAGAELHVSDD